MKCVSAGQGVLRLKTEYPISNTEIQYPKREPEADLNGTLCCVQHKVPYVALGVMLRGRVPSPFYWGHCLKYAT